MEKKIIAITGPSGAGKTTLGDLLIERNQFVCPIHTTTRSPRSDDKLNFYNYITHLEFAQNVFDNRFLFWSGDSEVVVKENGNFYGILQNDFKTVEDYDRIMMFISYKDILNLLKLTDYKFEIINLIYDNLEKSMINRLMADNRNHTIEDIKSRILTAKMYEHQYSALMESLGILRIPTDLYGIEETYNIVRKRVLK